MIFYQWFLNCTFSTPSLYLMSQPLSAHCNWFYFWIQTFSLAQCYLKKSHIFTKYCTSVKLIVFFCVCKQETRSLRPKLAGSQIFYLWLESGAKNQHMAQIPAAFFSKPTFLKATNFALLTSCFRLQTGTPANMDGSLQLPGGLGSQPTPPHHRQPLHGPRV